MRKQTTALLFLATVFLLTLPAQAQYQTPNAPQLGAAWYPEQWPEQYWDHDLQLMEQAHFTVVRIGEFAWSTLEPSENKYDLTWLDRAIALAAAHHLKVVLGTPTDAPPAWLTQKYPETLGTNADGHLREHGGRRQFNYANPHYRQLCAAIVRQLAQHYGHNPNILGWQIGNEYTDESFDPETRTQFQQLLRTKYKTLANLNTHWTTAYWSQTYSDWSQIPLASTHENPALLLEHKHFVTATWRSFQRNQIDVLRPLIAPTQFITTNIGGLAWSDDWDHYAMTEDLDLATWDDYVNPGPTGQHLNPDLNAMLNDFVRGWKRQNFWVMETEPGSVNWAPVNNVLAPGETRALAWQTIGHGADAVLYWQWRDALNGQEQYHGAITGPDGNPLPIYQEIKQLGEDLVVTRSALTGTSPKAEIALLHTYDSRWAIDFQPHTREYDQQQVLLSFYKPLARTQTVDIIDPTSSVDLTHYKLLVAPSLNVISESLAAKLLAYVQQGGHLFLGPRSGMKDEFNSLNPQRQPGPLAAALGAKVNQFYALSEPVPLIGHSLRGHGEMDVENAKANIWAEPLTPTSATTDVNITYGPGNGWLDGKPAMVTRQSGKGFISYLGTLPDELFMQKIVKEAERWLYLPVNRNYSPETVELTVRTGPHGPVFIVINHSDSPQVAWLFGGYKSLLPGLELTEHYQPTASKTTKFTLPPQGIAVLTQTWP